MKKVVLLLTLIVALEQPLFADISINGYSDATNDRFTDNSAEFVARAFDLSGVGQTDSPGRWATAISRNVIISAAHFPPSIGQTVYFYPSNDPSMSPVTGTVVRGERIGSTDLWIGTLGSFLPNSIASYNFATDPLTGTPPSGDNIFIEDAGPYQGLNAYLFGRSPFDENADPNDNRTIYNDQAVGRNIIEGYSENVPFQNNTDNDSLIMFTDAPGDANFVQYEALLQGGDSGGPMFVDINDEFVLLGTNAFILEGGGGSGVNYIGNQASFINGYIASAVPEPGSAAVLGILSICLIGRRRRLAVGSIGFRPKK